MSRLLLFSRKVAPRSTLLSGLSLYLKNDEASGPHVDATGTVTAFTNNNTVLGSPGQIGNAADLVAASSQSLSHADVAALRGGDHDWAWSAWVNLTTKTVTRSFVTKRLLTDYEYQLYYSSAADRFGIYCNGVDLRATAFGAPATATWYYVYAQYNAVGNLLGISVNGGAIATAALASGGSATAGPVSVGIDTTLYPMDGAIDELKFWSARTLTAAEIAEDYANGVAGRPLF